MPLLFSARAYPRQLEPVTSRRARIPTALPVSHGYEKKI
jgi:hypothetical protein